ncbi:hypothetical protein BD626DRAFT_540207 [Schizophyllum amplum]|uniref:MYND-type domain-containing protein n=1 Tax=Schizophyllum amplum TaxID=97359 RepID=A0A550BZZ6_9AGAR|nr:hypothetical protein BD626DRAFT_540207 [Auriculariopsis ampla]
MPDHSSTGVPFIDNFDQHARRVMDAAVDEVAARKARKKDMKTICGKCGKDKLVGTRLQTCSRCKSINYCSANCQRDHWQAGHKQECANFVQPPLSKTFDPSDRPDVPWPIHPIFASANQNCLGMWMTTAGELGTSLQQAFEPPEGRSTESSPEGPPSYQRWAGLKGPNRRAVGLELKKYTGSTLVSLRIVVQNRRTDGRAIAVIGGETRFTVFGDLKNNLFPEDRARATFTTTPGGSELMHVSPWKDYNGRLRVSIVEVNGVEAPKGKYAGRGGEYQPPTKPTGQPWDRVIDWDDGEMILGAGDYAVFCVQYRLGDGHEWKSYPEIISRSGGLNVPAFVTQAKSTDDGWRDKAWRELSMARIQPARPRDFFMLMATPDFKYIDEYYKPYFEEGPDEFDASRQGERAAQANEMLKKAVPMQMKMMMSMLTPDKRSEAVARFRAMGYDIEAILREADL